MLLHSTPRTSPPAPAARIALASALIAVIGLGCAATSAAAAKTELRVAVYANPDRWQAIAKRFMELNPDIDVKIVPVANYYTKIPVMVASGDGPDVGVVDTSWAEFAVNGLIMDLQPLIDRDKLDLSVLFPPALQQFKYQPGALGTGWGDQFAIPHTFQTPSMFMYNVDLFRNAGIAAPTKDWTWNTVRDIAAKLTAHSGDGKLTQIGYGTPPSGRSAIWPALNSAGGEFINRDYSRMMVDQPAAQRVYGFFYDMHKQGIMHGIPGGFMSGKMGMDTDGEWVIPVFRWHEKAKFTWDVAPWPRDPVTGKALIATDSNATAIFTGTKHLQEAWRWVKFMTSEDAATIFAKEYQSPVARIDVAVRYLYRRNTKGTPGDLPSRFWELPDQLQASQPILRGPDFGKISTLAHKDWNAALAGKISLTAALSHTEQAGNAILQSLRHPQSPAK